MKSQVERDEEEIERALRDYQRAGERLALLVLAAWLAVCAGCALIVLAP